MQNSLSFTELGHWQQRHGYAIFPPSTAVYETNTLNCINEKLSTPFLRLCHWFIAVQRYCLVHPQRGWSKDSIGTIILGSIWLLSTLSLKMPFSKTAYIPAPTIEIQISGLILWILVNRRGLQNYEPSNSFPAEECCCCPWQTEFHVLFR